MTTTDPCPRHVYGEPTDTCTCSDPAWTEHLYRIAMGWPR